MMPLTPIDLLNAAPMHFIGDIPFRSPAAGALGWRARMGLIGGAASLLWGMLLMLLQLFV